jgi:hypothetical protein
LNTPGGSYFIDPHERRRLWFIGGRSPLKFSERMRDEFERSGIPLDAEVEEHEEEADGQEDPQAGAAR